MAGQVWGTSSLGGYMYAGNLSKELRQAVQPLTRFRQFADIKDAAHQGLNKGDTFHWNVYNNVATQGTTLTEGTDIPETSYTITQGTLTIGEYGNSVPFSEKLDDLSEHSVREVVNKVLKNDAAKAMDVAAAAQFDAAPLRMVGTTTAAATLTTNGTATATNTSVLNTYHVKNIVDTMKERNIPSYQFGDYFCVAWPSTLRSLKNSLETVHQYTSEGFGMIMNGEIGRYEGVRFIEQTNIAKGTGMGTDTSSTWSGGLSDWAVFFGEDTVAEAIAVPEEVRGKIPTDYGRNRGIAWYYLGGFGVVHTAAAEARILIWDSAA